MVTDEDIQTVGVFNQPKNWLDPVFNSIWMFQLTNRADVLQDLQKLRLYPCFPGLQENVKIEEIQEKWSTLQSDNVDEENSIHSPHRIKGNAFLLSSMSINSTFAVGISGISSNSISSCSCSVRVTFDILFTYSQFFR